MVYSGAEKERTKALEENIFLINTKCNLTKSDLNAGEDNPLINIDYYLINPVSLFSAVTKVKKKKEEESPAAKLTVYHCYPDFIHCRDPKAGRGHYKPRKPKGIGINMCFMGSKSNLQEVSIESLVLLVHLCIKCTSVL